MLKPESIVRGWLIGIYVLCGSAQRGTSPLAAEANIVIYYNVNYVTYWKTCANPYCVYTQTELNLNLCVEILEAFLIHIIHNLIVRNNINDILFQQVY